MGRIVRTNPSATSVILTSQVLMCFVNLIQWLPILTLPLYQTHGAVTTHIQTENQNANQCVSKLIGSITPYNDGVASTDFGSNASTGELTPWLVYPIWLFHFMGVIDQNTCRNASHQAVMEIIPTQRFVDTRSLPTPRCESSGANHAPTPNSIGYQMYAIS